MADEENHIKWILEATDNASATISAAADNMGSAIEGAKLQFIAFGAIAAAALGEAVSAAMDEDAAITRAARATADAAGGFDKAKLSITELNAKMEAQGFSTDKTTEALTLLVTKAGMDMPTALKKAGDFIAFAEERNISLQQAVKILTGEENTNKQAFDENSQAMEKNASEMEKVDAKIAALEMKFEEGKISLDDFTSASEELEKEHSKVTQKSNELSDALKILVEQSEKEKSAIDGSLDARAKSLTLTDKMAIANEKFGNIMESVGNKLMPVVEAALDFATKLMDGFDKLDAPTKELLTTFGVIVGVILSVVGAATGLVAVFGPFIPIITSVVAFGGTLFGILTTGVGTIGGIVAALNPFSLIILAIIAAIIGFKLAWDANLFGIQEVVGNFVKWIQENVGRVLAGIILLPLVPLIALKAAWDSNIGDIQGAVGGFVTAIRTFFEDLITNLVTFVTNFVTAIIKFVLDINKRWTDWIAGLLKQITSFGTDVLVEIGKFVKGVTDAFVALIAKGLEWGAKLVSNVLKGITDAAGQIAGAAASAAGAAFDLISGKKTKGATGLVAQGIRPLAMGGIVDRPTLALIGEGGENEYVIPESKMQQFLGGSGGNTNVTVTNYINGAQDPRMVAQEVSDAIMSALGSSNSTSMASIRG